MKTKIYSICTVLCIVLALKSFGQCSTTAPVTSTVTGQANYIQTFALNSVFSTGSSGIGANRYTDLSSTNSFTIQSGSTVNLQWTKTGANGTACMWIDFNNNGVFESTENFYQSPNQSSDNVNIALPLTSVINVPLKARLRLYVTPGFSPPSDPCLPYDNLYGETEDYTVVFTCPGNLSFLSNTNLIASGESQANTKVCNNSGFLMVNYNPFTNFTYTWMPGNSNVALLPISTTSSSVTYSATVSMAACPALQNTLSRTFTILQTPTISVSGNTTICNGQSTTFTGSGANTYLWAHLGGAMNPVSVSPTTTTVYTVTGITDDVDFPVNQAFNGCMHTLTPTVQVVASPTISISNATVCAGSSFTLNPTGASSYTFSGGNAVVSPTATSVYTITGSNGACSSSKNVTITTIALPSVTVNGGAICLGNSFTISPTGASSYTYSSGSAIVSPTTTTVYSVTGTTGSCSQTKTLTVVTDIAPTDGYSISPLIPAFACAPSKTVTILSAFSSTASVSSYSTSYWLPNTWPSSASGYGNIALTAPTTFTLHNIKSGNSCAKIYTITVDIAPALTIAITPTAQTVCNGTPVILTASGADTYSWNNSVSNGVAFTPTVTKTYVATGTNTTTGCTASKNVTITVNPSPTVQLYTSNTSLTLCNGQSMTIDLFGALSYTLVNTSEASGGNNTFTVSPTTTTTYTIIGESSYGCVSSAPPLTVTVTTCTGIEETTNNNLVSIYPNPANDFITASLVAEFADATTIYITNTLGEIVLTERPMSSNATLNTSNLTNGIYFVKIESKNGLAIKKFIKQ